MTVYIVTENIGWAHEEYKVNRKVCKSEEAAEKWIEERSAIEKTQAYKFEVEEWEVE